MEFIRLPPCLTAGHMAANLEAIRRWLISAPSTVTSGPRPFAERFPAYMTRETAAACLAASRKRRAQHRLRNAIKALDETPIGIAARKTEEYRRSCMRAGCDFDPVMADIIYTKALRDEMGQPYCPGD